MVHRKQIHLVCQMIAQRGRRDFQIVIHEDRIEFAVLSLILLHDKTVSVFSKIILPDDTVQFILLLDRFLDRASDFIDKIILKDFHSSPCLFRRTLG